MSADAVERPRVSWSDVTPAQLAHELHDETLMLTMARSLDVMRARRAARMAMLLSVFLEAVSNRYGMTPIADAFPLEHRGADRIGELCRAMDFLHPRPGAR